MATASPRDMGTAIRKTVIEADRSAPEIRKRAPSPLGDGPCDGRTRVRVDEESEGISVRVGTQAGMVPVSSGVAWSRDKGDAAVGHGVRCAAVGLPTLGK